MSTLVTANNHTVDARAFRQALIQWGSQNFRDFPWRHTRNPYHLLIAEVMLHRTQAKQVAPVYQKFLIDFPDVEALCGASKEALHEHLYSLGLRWRIDLLYEMAEELASKHNKNIPQGKEALLTLPGVSEYIASAVRCFAWNLPEALIDTNTVRVVGRLFHLKIKDSSRRSRQFRELIEALVDPKNPRAYNFALLDLADKVCTIKTPPKHPACPLQDLCLLFLQKEEDR